MEMRSLIRLVIWAALISVGAWLTIPLAGVPITLQSLFLLLAGLLAGPKVAVGAAILYLGAGLLGLPVFSGGLAGPAIFFSPTVGFAFSFPLVAFVASWGRIKNEKEKPYWRAFAFCVLASLVLYVGGLAGLLLKTQMPLTKALMVIVPFILGDALKCAAAASIYQSKVRMARQKGPLGES